MKADTRELVLRCDVCHGLFAGKGEWHLKTSCKCGSCRIQSDDEKGIAWTEVRPGASYTHPTLVTGGMYEFYKGPKKWRQGIGKVFSIPGVPPDSDRAQGTPPQPHILIPNGVWGRKENAR